MAVAVFAIDITIVVDEIFISGIVRGIYIYDIDFTFVGIGESS